VLVVPGIGTDAEDPRAARFAACGEGGGVELVTKGMRTIVASITSPTRMASFARVRRQGAARPPPLRAVNPGLEFQGVQRPPNIHLRPGIHLRAAN
jgi:hypothetical protein